MLEKIQRRATKLIPGMWTDNARNAKIEVFKILNGYENVDSNIFSKLGKVK